MAWPVPGRFAQPGGTRAAGAATSRTTPAEGLASARREPENAGGVAIGVLGRVRGDGVNIEERRLAGVTVLTAAGRLDQDAAAGFQARLLGLVEVAGAKVALDFAGLDYISSVGLRALMIAAKKSKAAGGALTVAALTPVVREIFEISRFNFVVPVFADLRAALASMSADAAAALDAGA